MSLKIVANNRKAFHEYAISDRYEAGLILTGTEVKSARLGKVNLGEGWVDIDENGEAFMRDVNISKYSHGSFSNHEETRPRKLLLNKKELAKLAASAQIKGYTLVPLKMYFKDQFLKVEIGVAKGKQAHDKRDATREREANRDIARAMRTRRK
jgi:SsrA-binding protein